MATNMREKGRSEERTMRAIGFRRYGPPEVLEAFELPRAEPGPGEVLIRVAAAGVNPADWALRGGQIRLFVRLKLPFVPGSDVAGVVEAVGPGVTRVEPGEAVFAMTPAASGGGYAEFVTVAEHDVARVPPELTLAEAASVPLAALTALQALRDKAGLGSGDHVLINGASGGVGTFAVQIAKAMGARVTATCSGRNVALVRGLGADEVLDYAREDVTAGEARYDAIFDAVGNHTIGQWRRVLLPKGVVVTVIPALGVIRQHLLARLSGGEQRLRSVFVRPGGADLEVVAGWISAAQVRPVIDQNYPLCDAIAAHRYSESRRVRGKLILVVDERLAVASAKSFSKDQIPGGTAA